MLNIEKYKEQLIKVAEYQWTKDEEIKYKDFIFDLGFTAIDYGCKGKFTDESNDFVGLIEWLCEEYKEPILDDAEREYLSAVIKPFRDRVDYITIVNNDLENQMVIIAYDLCHECNLPIFKKGTMYKGMESYKKYTLEELGL